VEAVLKPVSDADDAKNGSIGVVDVIVVVIECEPPPIVGDRFLDRFDRVANQVLNHAKDVELVVKGLRRVFLNLVFDPDMAYSSFGR